MNRRAALCADQVLQRVRGSKEPTRADAARNFAALEARLMAAGSSVSAGSNARAGSSARAGGEGPLRWPWLVRAGKLAAFGLATGLVGYWIGRADTPQRPLEMPVVSTSSAAPPALESPALPAPQEPPHAPEPPAAHLERAAPRRVLVPPARRPSSHHSDPPAAEKPQRGFELSEAIELLRRAESAVRHSDGLQARMWLGDLDRRAPRDLLREERLVTSVLASCVLGEVATAREALAELEQANPQSMYRSRLEGSCATSAPRP